MLSKATKGWGGGRGRGTQDFLESQGLGVNISNKIFL